jgi:hypothetical protein
MEVFMIKKNNLFRIIVIVYMSIIISTTLLRVYFKLSPIGNYTDVGLTIVGLYLFTLFLIREKIYNKITAHIVFIFVSLIPIINQVLFLSQEEVYFSSPKNTNTLIIVERSSFHHGYSSIYEKKHLLFKKPVNWTQVDGLRNFSSGFFTIEWTKEDIAIMKRNGEHYGQINLD